MTGRLQHSEGIANGYEMLFPRRLRQAHYALVSWAEEENPDGWPTPADVQRFANLYRVPRAELGGLVGMLATQHGRRTGWIDAVRNRATVYPFAIRQHDEKVRRAFGWFCATTDLGWLALREPTLH